MGDEGNGKYAKDKLPYKTCNWCCNGSSFFIRSWYLESAYEQALAIELQSRKIPFERQKVFNLDYKGECIGEGRMDFYVDYILVVELKAVDTLLPVHAAQVISYLKAMDREVGLLLNFHTETFKKGIRRILNPDYREEIINKEK